LGEKRLAAERAVQYVRDGMLVGLGTGSTAAFAILELGKRVRDGLRVTGVASSRSTEDLARSAGIPLTDFSGLSHLDLTIDGADEIDGDLRAVKGAGGALFREKVLAAASGLMIAIVDSSKLVKKLGRAKVPVEVLPFAAGSVKESLLQLNAQVLARNTESGSTFVTEQGNYIFDLFFQHGYDPDALALSLDRTTGVVEHGLFLTEIDLLVIGSEGRIEEKKRPSNGRINDPELRNLG
jgi:ribose 5-phosphate isomerase A